MVAEAPGVLCVIPARGGSQRIPRKNIIPFDGRPMICRTIEAARQSGIAAHILVSTDDEEIAEISRAAGAVVPFLRQEASDAFSPVSAATVHAVAQFEAFAGGSVHTVVQLMANCPLRTAEDVRSQFAAHQAQPEFSLLSSFEYGWMNPWWAHSLDGNGQARPIFDDTVRNRRSQDQEKLYCPSGATWISSAAKLKQHGTFYSPQYRFHPISWQSALDIDDLEDLAMAKAVLAMQR